ncbi:MAG: hypothetical protein KatS3mg034_0982 [Vicingaceae bacterium]|nr:MAG: hypothetical protein KatS3mg034_0982 [Vicingaceae bacterium]
MKLFRLLFLLSVCITFQKKLNAENEIRVKNPPHFAKVYLNASEMFHNIKVTLQAGQNTLVITHLSPNVMDESIQMNLQDDLELLSVDYRRHYLTEEEKSKEWKRAKDSLDLIEAQISKLQQELKSWQVQSQIIDQNKKITGDNVKITTTDLAALMDFYFKKTLEIEAKINTLNEQKKELENTKQKLLLQLQQIENRLAKSYGEIVLELTAKQTKVYHIELSYITHNLFWKPVYDVSSEGPDKKIDLKFKAEIYNQTGMDYNQLQVSFSSSLPAGNLHVNQLSPWWLDFFEPQYYKSEKDVLNEPKPLMLNEVELNEANARYKSGAIKSSNLQVLESQLNVEFSYSPKIDLPAYPSKKIIKLDQYTVDAVYDYYTIPKLTEKVYLLAGLLDWQKLNLLSGDLQVFFSGHYAGKGYLNLNVPEDTIKINFGVDEKLPVKRIKVKDITEKANMGRDKKVTLGYEIQLKNNHNIPVTIEVIDQIPVSKNSNIKVESIETTGAQVESSTGILKWKITLSPGEQKKIYFSFSVQYPKDKTVILR